MTCTAHPISLGDAARLSADNAIRAFLEARDDRAAAIDEMVARGTITEAEANRWRDEFGVRGAA